MAKFEIKKTEPQAPPPAAAKAPEPTVPATALVHDAKVLREMGDVVREKDPKSDDPIMTNHPTKDYALNDNAARMGGQRSFQPDLLARQLNASMFFLDQSFPWADNPLGGAPLAVTYSRHFPEKKVLYDNFDLTPDVKLMNAKREMAHSHGFKYICQLPGLPMTPAELDKQMTIEDEWAKGSKK